MYKTSTLIRHFIIFGVPIGLLTILILLMESSLLSDNQTLSLAITIDLVIFVPAFYFLLIRKTEIPKTTVLPVMFIGLLIGSYFLPEKSQNYLDIFKVWILPIIEIVVLFYIIFKVRKAVATFREFKKGQPDFYEGLKKTCIDLVPKRFVYLAATEIAVLYYGFIHWKKRSISENEFTYHKNSGTPALLGGILLIIAIETVALHYFLLKWSSIAAWLVTALSIYTAIQLFAFARSLSKRPISIENDQLQLRYGFMSETNIDIHAIASVEVTSGDIEMTKETRKLSFLGSMESHNILIRLKSDAILTGLYGIKRTYRNIAFYVDDKAAFTRKIQDVLGKY